MYAYLVWKKKLTKMNLFTSNSGYKDGVVDYIIIYYIEEPFKTNR